MQPAQSANPAFKNGPTPIAVGETDAAIAIGISVFFLRKDRRGKRLIPFYRVGDRALYDLDRVRAALLALEEGGLQLRGAKRACKGPR